MLRPALLFQVAQNSVWSGRLSNKCVSMLAGFAAFTMALSTAAQAQDQDVVGVISGSVTGTYARFAHQMSLVVDSEDLRVLPMMGKGSQQNVKDLLFLNGVDVAIVQSDVLDFYKSNNTIPGLEDSIRYIGKLYNEEIHVVVPKGTRALKALEGGLVAVGGSGSGTEMTAVTLFDALDIEIVPVNASNAEALQQVSEGNLDAAVFVVGKPSSLLQSVAAADNLTLLPIELPKSIQGSYFETAFSGQDYPNLIDQGISQPTIAVGAVLAVFNWREGTSRHKAVSAFVDRLDDALRVLQDDSIYHPKWKEVDLSVDVPGWTRF